MRDGRVTLELSGSPSRTPAPGDPCGTASASRGQEAEEPMSVATEMSEAAERWLASLDDAQRWRALFPAPSPSDAGRTPGERMTWFYTPTDHGGLPLGGQRPAQQGLAMRLVAAGLSLAGYSTVAVVMGLENVLDRAELWTRDWGRERGRDPGLYYLALFGLPGGDAWGWRFGGHHVSLNYTVIAGRVTSCTPSFIGAHPARTGLIADGTLAPLGNLESTARLLALSLRDRGAAAAFLHPRAVSDIVSGNRAYVDDGDEMIHMQDLWRSRFADRRLHDLVDQVDVVAESASGYGQADHRRLAITRQPKGVAGRDLTEAEQGLLTTLARGYLGRFPDEIADQWLAGYRSPDGLGGLHFAYAGAAAPAGPVYYRLQDTRLLAEYDNTQYDANHAHSVVRDLTADFGADALAAHWQRHH
jgi:hypothetical protein